ncbi:MAG: calcium-binding EGF-like domain-containing protein [Candidatus Thiodiazotropha sp.]
MDECITGDNIGSPDADCYNTPGSYYCICVTGFHGDGFTCTGSVRRDENTLLHFPPPLEGIQPLGLFVSFPEKHSFDLK